MACHRGMPDFFDVLIGACESRRDWSFGESGSPSFGRCEPAPVLAAPDDFPKVSLQNDRGALTSLTGVEPEAYDDSHGVHEGTRLGVPGTLCFAGGTDMAVTLDAGARHMQALQWSRLNHIADVKPIDDSDAACLEEVRQILMKHGALSRFGVSLLHSHFDLSDDEIMMETTDLERREQLVRPVKKSWLEDEGVTAQTTVVCFDENGCSLYCGCDPRATGHHHK